MSQDTPNTSGTKPTPVKTSTLDWFQFTIAMILVVSFTIFEGFVIWGNPKFDQTFQIISMTAPFVGTIIGFYFGQRPIQNLSQQVSEANSKKQTIGSSFVEASNIISSDSKEMQDLKNQIKELKEGIESLKSQNGE